MRYVRCHIICILEQLHMKLINNLLLFNVFVKKCGSMVIAIKVKFLRNVSFFLYRSWVFTIEEEFQIKFSIFYTKFYIYQQAKDFIDEKLVLKKEKSAAFYTKHIFTAGHTSSQRSEFFEWFDKRFWIVEEGNGAMEYISANDLVRSMC